MTRQAHTPSLHGFLAAMASASAKRAIELHPRERELRDRAANQVPALVPKRKGFDVIAEIKLNSPSEGALCADIDPDLSGRVQAYGRAGATAISVLTEPTRFGGSLDHLRLAAQHAHAIGLPVMRKDFLVEALQVVEARASAADGVLLIARIVSDAVLEHMLEVAHEQQLFVLLEAFDRDDLGRIKNLIAARRDLASNLFVGLNARDLDTLDVDPTRQLNLAQELPTHTSCVAESGIHSPADAARAAQAGYGLILVGTALMRASDPEQLLGELLAAGRRTSAEVCLASKAEQVAR